MSKLKDGLTLTIHLGSRSAPVMPGSIGTSRRACRGTRQHDRFWRAGPRAIAPRRNFRFHHRTESRVTARNRGHFGASVKKERVERWLNKQS